MLLRSSSSPLEECSSWYRFTFYFLVVEVVLMFLKKGLSIISCKSLFVLASSKLDGRISWHLQEKQIVSVLKYLSHL